MSEAAPALPVLSYGRLAWCYDELAAVYSFGRIRASKHWLVDGLAPGERALFVGVGRGSDAVRAARRGVEVTALDVAPAMLNRLGRRLQREGLNARLVCQDLLAHRADAAYDAVVASYVLDLYAAPGARRALAHLVRQVRPGGRVLVADFAAGRRFARLHHGLACAVAGSLGLAERHSVHDCGALLAEAGCSVEERREFPLFRGGPVAFEALRARRSAPRAPVGAAADYTGRRGG